MSADVLGIMAFVHPSATRPFGEQTGYIRGLLQVARELGLRAYAFGPEHVNLARKSVTAYVATSTGWRRVQRRMPRLVYDRFFLHLPRTQVLRRYRLLLRSGVFQFLNPTLPDKWKVHVCLMGHKNLRRWLPATRPYRDVQQMTKFLRKWGEVVLKPKQGMKGRGLWFISSAGPQIVVRKGTQGRTVLSRTELRPWAFQNLSKGYIMQQQLHLRDHLGRPFDIRVLVQRNGQNELLVTGAGVRVGKAGAFVANLHQGGRALTLAAAVGSFPEMASVNDGTGLEEGAADISQHVATAALQIARSLDRHYGPLAEVGLDFGFDLRSRRLYFIEANSRPGRIIFRRMGDHAARELAIRRPLEYAGYRLRSGR